MTAQAPYRSAEISNASMAPPGLYRLFGTPGCAVFDDKLWIVGPWFTPEAASSYGLLYQTTLALTDPTHAGRTIDIENDAVAAASLWSTQPITIGGYDLPVQVDIGWRNPTFSMQDNVAPSSVGLSALGDKLVLVWNASRDPEFIAAGDPPNLAVRAALYSRDGDGLPAWRSAVQLQDHDGNALFAATSTAGVRSAAFGADSVIVACFAIARGDGESNGQMYLGWFRPDDIDQKAMTWRAAEGAFVLGGVASVWLDWFTGGVKPDGAANDPAAAPPSFVLWLSALDAAEPGRTVVTDLIPFDEGYRMQSPPLEFSSTMRGTTVRDPAGRIVRYEGDAGSVRLRTYHTAGAPDGAEPFPSHDLVLTAPSAQDPEADVSFGHPAAAYFTDQTRGVPVTRNNCTGTAYPVYEFLFYGPCLVRRYGTAEVYPEYGHDISLTPAVHNTIVIAGIIDGPIPIPNENLANINFTDTEPEFATVQYGMTTAKDKEHTVKSSWTVGFKTEGESTEGVGPAWDISLSGGMASVQTDHSAKTVSTMKSGSSILDDATRNQHGRQAVLPVGHVFGARARFSWTAFRFIDADGSTAADGADGGDTQAPLFATMSCQFDAGDTDTYLPYAVRPGDLSSYTPESWTQRMQELGWSGTDYVREVIEPNAQPLTTQHFLRFSVDNGGGTVTETYEEISGRFTETGWSIDADVYVGISGGEGVSLFGLGENTTFKFLVGGTYSHETVDSETNEHGVTVGLTEEGITLPRANEDPTVVKNYSFRLYYLPPPGPDSGLAPNHWVDELKTCIAHGPQGPDQLDPARIDSGAHAWKIVFVVDHYELYDNTSYDYTG